MLKQIRNKNNQIIVQILHNVNTKKDVPYYEKLVSTTNKQAQIIDVPKSLDDYYNSLGN